MKIPTKLLKKRATAKVNPGNLDEDKKKSDASAFAKGSVGAAREQFEWDGGEADELIFIRPVRTKNSDCKLIMLHLDTHLSYAHFLSIVDAQNEQKLFHLLIEYMPELACKAVDAFRRPLFRCSIVKGLREFEQSWDVDRELSVYNNNRMKVLLKRMITKPKPVIPPAPTNPLIRGLMAAFNILITIFTVLPKSFFQNETVFTKDEIDEGIEFVDDAVREPKGILYEYRYSSEMANGLSPTLELIVRVCNQKFSTVSHLNYDVDGMQRIDAAPVV